MKSGRLEDLLNQESTWVVAHRGDSAHFPENTLAAFRSALEKGADMIELDLRMSRDREPVVIHDQTLDRTTNTQGRVVDLNFAELRKLDCGSWFDPVFQGASLPSLEEVLELVSDRIALNLEIKSDNLETQSGKDGIESRVCELVYDYGLQDQVVVSSFEHGNLTKVRNNSKSLPVAVLLNRQTSFAEMSSLVRDLNAFSCHNNIKHLSLELIQELKEKGIAVLAYTVNDERRMRQLVEWGITGIITNNPAKLRKMLNN